MNKLNQLITEVLELEAKYKANNIKYTEINDLVNLTWKNGPRLAKALQVAIEALDKYADASGALHHSSGILFGSGDAKHALAEIEKILEEKK